MVSGIISYKCESELCPHEIFPESLLERKGQFVFTCNVSFGL